MGQLRRPKKTNFFLNYPSMYIYIYIEGTRLGGRSSQTKGGAASVGGGQGQGQETPYKIFFCFAIASVSRTVIPTVIAQHKLVFSLFSFFFPLLALP